MSLIRVGRFYAQFVRDQSVVISAKFAQTGFVRTLAAAFYHGSSARNAKGINGSVLGISHTRARIRCSQRQQPSASQRTRNDNRRQFRFPRFAEAGDQAGNSADTTVERPNPYRECRRREL